MLIFLLTLFTVMIESPQSAIEESEVWYDQNIDKYQELALKVKDDLKAALKASPIEFIDIQQRCKTKESYKKKISEKQIFGEYSYLNMTDLAGIRVITLIQSDVDEVCNIIKKMYNIHENHSINKSEELGSEKVGYRSIHFICDIGLERGKQPEYKNLSGLNFEIQVRTSLQHAWAEINHDKNYKLDGELPVKLKRRFSLLSAILETADLEFSRLTVEVEEYSKNIAEKIENNNLDEKLSTIGIKALIKNKYNKWIKNNEESDSKGATKLIEDLNNFGIEGLSELDNIIINMLKFLNDEDNGAFNNGKSFIRFACIMHDLNRFLEINGTRMYEISANKKFKKTRHMYLLFERYSENDVIEAFKNIGISIS